jgi:hypothetical protein
MSTRQKRTGTMMCVLSVCAGIQAQVTLSNPTAAATNHVAVSQLDSTGDSNVQTRNLLSDLSQWRVITETFYWTSAEDFDGIGLYLGEGNDAYWTETSTQTYHLVIQELAAGNVPTTTVLSVEFELTGDKVGDGQWLYIDTPDADLKAGLLYGFSLGPAEGDVNGSLRTYWDTATSVPFPGLARQYTPGTGGIPKTDDYSAGTSVPDYTFYMIHTEPVVALSNPAAAPAENVAISQLDSTGTAIQARNLYTDLSQWRIITETFHWPVAENFDGIGFYMGTGNESYWNETSTQTYQFVIQELATGSIPTATVLNVEFLLTGDRVADGQWLYVDTPDVALKEGQLYGMSLGPAERDIKPMRTFWATATSSPFPGIARAYSVDGGIPKTDDYTVGGGVQDYTFFMVHSERVVLSNPSGIPPLNVAFSQPDASGAANVQARNRASNLSDWRVVTQTFQWPTTNVCDGIGLCLGVGNEALWSGTSTQTYQFVIQSVDGTNLPTATVLDAKFHLTGDKVADGQWLYIDFPDVNLETNQWYGFSMGPAETAVDGGLRTYWATADANIYPGLTRQYAPSASGDIPKSDSYEDGGGVNDYAFYFVESPSGNTPAYITGWSPVSGDIVKMTVYIPGETGSYRPESATNLMSGSWSVVPHSIDGNEPFVATNMDYSAAASNGTDRVIYLKADGSQGFFNVSAGE